MATALDLPQTPPPGTLDDARRDPYAAADPTMPVVPSREDDVVAAASEVVGGPVGKRAVIGHRGLAGALLSLVAAVTVLMGLGVAERAHCVKNGWSTPDHFWHACYTDIPVVYQSSGLSAGGSPLSATAALGQALPTALVSWVLGRLVPGDGFAGVPLTGLNQARWYFALWSVAATVMLVGLAVGLVRGQPRHPWRAVHLASPALPFLALVSFEVVPVTLAGVGLLAWGRRRPILAGVLLALAVIARPWAIFVVLAIALISVRTGRMSGIAGLLGSALMTTAAVAGLVGVLGGNPFAVYRSWWSTGAGYGSPWYLASLGGYQWTPSLLTMLTGASWVLALVVGAVFALSCRRRPRVGELALVMLVIAILLGKALPVQAGLWMILLMAVVGVRWWVHLTWAGVEVAYFVAVWLHIAATSAPDRGLPAGWYAVFVVARLAAWALVAWEVWRRAARRPAALVVAAPDPAVEPIEAGEPLAQPPVVPAPAGQHDIAPAVGPDEVPAPVRHGEAAGAEGHAVSGATRAEPQTRRDLADARSQAAHAGRSPRSADVAVIDDDELAGECAGAPDRTVVSFV